MCERLKLVIMGHFLPFPLTFFCHFGPVATLLPPNKPGNENFEKMKKTPGDTHHFKRVYHK